MYKEHKIALGIPVFNEKAKVPSIIRRLEAVPFIDEIVFVDDCSDDGTYEFLKEQGRFAVIRHSQRCGAGSAIRSFFAHLLDSGCDIAVVMAGNDKDRPEEITRLLDSIIENGNDLVQGSRYLSSGSSGNMPLMRIIATRWVHPLLFTLASGKKMTDTTNGFRAVRVSLLRALWPDLQQDWLDKYELEPYLLYKSIREGYKVAEAPVTKIYPDHKLGYTKFSGLGDFWSIMRPLFLLKLKLRR
ncbi:MAG: glycosyltransferase family 2 protein [Nitrospirae bacterium]|nr:glycosyltransferase family 2 protein [Nitrospirota bacterium]